MWSHYWDEITDRIAKCLLVVLKSCQREIEFYCPDSKIRDLTRNLQQNHSSLCDITNICAINLFVFSNLVPRVSWLPDREEGPFISKANIFWERGSVFSCGVKTELQSPTQVSHVTKKNTWVKNAKKLRKSQGFIEILINLPLQWMVTSSSHPQGRTEERVAAALKIKVLLVPVNWSLLPWSRLSSHFLWWSQDYLFNLVW